MLGIATPYARLPYFYSDQYDLGMEYSGFATAGTGWWSAAMFTREFIAFWLKDGQVVAA